MLCSPEVYSHFSFPGIERSAIIAFAVPDLVVISTLSLIVWRRRNSILQACILGGVTFGTLWCVAASFLSKGGFLSAIVMILGTLFNVMLLMGQGVFKMSVTTNRRTNLVKTLLQCIVIWTVLLLVVPMGIIHAFGNWPPNPDSLHRMVGISCFLLFSAIGIWSGIVMTVGGGGTPLPLDSPRRLVVTGPYAYVRNPMAISGLGQGFSVAFILSSIPVTVYVATGILIWNYFVRPKEERFMQEAFGADFEKYRDEVGCWIPRKIGSQ